MKTKRQGRTNKIVCMHHEVDVLQQLDSLLTALLQGLRQEFPLYEATLPAQRSSNCQQPLLQTALCGSACVL